MGLAIGCAVPAASKYPADISGHVTIADKLILHGRESAPSENDYVSWIVDVSIKNESYEDAITSLPGHWRIVVGNEMYEVAAFLKVIWDEASEPEITSGQTGRLTTVFSVPRSLTLSDAQLRYQGQEPYSYGKLTGGDKVVAYDWNSKTVITEEEKPEERPTEHIGKMEEYLFEKQGKIERIKLRTIAYWEGDSRDTKIFVANDSPLVLNAGFTPTSEISAGLSVFIDNLSWRGEVTRHITVPWWSYSGTKFDIGCHTLTPSSFANEYEISVNPTNCEWWIKIGVEP